MDTTAVAATTTVTMAAMTADSTEAYSMAYSMTTSVATTVATVAATRDSACSAKHRSARELRPLRAGQTSRWQAGPGALSPAIRRGSVMLVKLVVRRDVDDRARAQLTDVVEVAVPVGGHADGGQARSVPGESEGAPASRQRVWRASGAGGAAEAGLTSLKSSKV
jgi:hypothetical protein